MGIRQFFGPFACYAICALSIAGCFGGDNDSSTTGPETPMDTTRKIAPGLYVSDYSWIDTIRFAGMESEFLMDADGTFKHLFVYDDEAIFYHSGRWAQSGGNFLFTGILVSQTVHGIFDEFVPMEDDTNSVRDVTDSTFTRREWTPLRQKPYWITYKRKTDFPKVSEGAYYHHVYDTIPIVRDTSDTTGAVDTFKVVDNLYHFEIGGGDSLEFSTTVDSLEIYQLGAKYGHFGSFLFTEEHRYREADSTHAFGEWETGEGIIFLKLKEVTDTAFVLQTPLFSPEPDGFLPYSKNGK
jgi:hypothetical protein